MAKKNLVVCDACGASKLTSESTGRPWLQLQSIASGDEYAEVMVQLQDGAELSNLIDSGDFCSLKCVANWASARANLRELDADA